LTRLIKINHSNENVEDIHKRVYATDGKIENIPVEVQGEVLPLFKTID